MPSHATFMAGATALAVVLALTAPARAATTIQIDNGGYLLNVSINGTPLTQLSATHNHTPVFLDAGPNVITAANASLSVDHYVRDGGDGSCSLP